MLGGAGGLAEGEGGRDTEASNALFAIGGATTMLATPIIHIARGHTERGVGSLLMRGGLAGVGAVVAFAANSGCHDGESSQGILDDDFLCELDYVGYGILGGLIVASAIDAAFMTDERSARAGPRRPGRTTTAGAGLALTW